MTSYLSSTALEQCLLESYSINSGFCYYLAYQCRVHFIVTVVAMLSEWPT